jgi:hypothetical protein
VGQQGGRLLSWRQPCPSPSGVAPAARRRASPEGPCHSRRTPGGPPPPPKPGSSGSRREQAARRASD